MARDNTSCNKGCEFLHFPLRCFTARHCNCMATLRQPLFGLQWAINIEYGRSTRTSKCLDVQCDYSAGGPKYRNPRSTNCTLLRPFPTGHQSCRHTRLTSCLSYRVYYSAGGRLTSTQPSTIPSLGPCVRIMLEAHVGSACSAFLYVPNCPIYDLRDFQRFFKQRYNLRY
jgi:hypothetical protein